MPRNYEYLLEILQAKENYKQYHFLRQGHNFSYISHKQEDIYSESKVAAFCNISRSLPFHCTPSHVYELPTYVSTSQNLPCF